MGAAAQTRHNEFVVKNGLSPGYFFTATGEVGTHLYVPPGSRLFVHYSTARKNLLKEAFVMEAVEIPPRSVFAGRGYVQHAESEWCGEQCPSYHGHPTAENHDLPDAIAFD